MEALVRQAANAGRFYPARADELSAMVDGLLAEALLPTGIEPVAIVCPHAGIIFSGRTAAHGYRLAQGHNFERVIVLAPSHYAAFPGASIFFGNAYATPLGDVPIDVNFVQRLREGSMLFQYHRLAHTQEHSLEVQLPFLQRALVEFLLVPIVIHDYSFENCRVIADAIAKAMLEEKNSVDKPPKTLIVASSDLFHGPGAQEAKDMSVETVRAIATETPQEFCEGNLDGKYMACGAGPVTVAMLLAERLGATKRTVLNITTSYEVYPRGEDYVVGYGSIAFSRP